jgi:hypothetical protein
MVADNTARLGGCAALSGKAGEGFFLPRLLEAFDP